MHRSQPLTAPLLMGGDGCRQGNRSRARDERPRPLKEDFGSEAAQEVVDENGAAQESLGVVDEAHFVQREVKDVAVFLEHRGHLQDRRRITGWGFFCFNQNLILSLGIKQVYSFNLLSKGYL